MESSPNLLTQSNKEQNIPTSINPIVEYTSKSLASLSRGENRGINPNAHITNRK